MPKLDRLESELREQARQLIRQGSLPSAAPRQVWGGPGAGLSCALCGDAIPKSELEYEIDSKTGVLHFHFMCHAAWQLECLRATPGKTEAPSPGLAPDPGAEKW